MLHDNSWDVHIDLRHLPGVCIKGNQVHDLWRHTRNRKTIPESRMTCGDTLNRKSNTENGESAGSNVPETEGNSNGWHLTGHHTHDRGQTRKSMHLNQKSIHAAQSPQAVQYDWPSISSWCEENPKKVQRWCPGCFPHAVHMQNMTVPQTRIRNNNAVTNCDYVHSGHEIQIVHDAKQKGACRSGDHNKVSKTCEGQHDFTFRLGQSLGLQRLQKLIWAIETFLTK